MEMRSNTISEEAYQEIVEAEKRTTDKRLSKKLNILLLRFGGKSIAETAEQMNCSVSKVRRLVAEYHRDGLVEYMRSKYAGNHRSLSIEEENEILSSFKKKADAGQIITVQDIKRAFDERIGKDTGRGYIYMLLKRHEWRKVMPRAKHPKKADDEAIEASKKLKTI